MKIAFVALLVLLALAFRVDTCAGALKFVVGVNGHDQSRPTTAGARRIEMVGLQLQEIEYINESAAPAPSPVPSSSDEIKSTMHSINTKLDRLDEKLEEALGRNNAIMLQQYSSQNAAQIAQIHSLYELLASLVQPRPDTLTTATAKRRVEYPPHYVQFPSTEQLTTQLLITDETGIEKIVRYYVLADQEAQQLLHMDYEGAQTACLEPSGKSNRQVLTIKSKRENEFINQWLFDELKLDGYEKVWLGLTRVANGTNDFVWVDGTPIAAHSTYTNWYTGEPTGINKWGRGEGDWNENCVEMYGPNPDIRSPEFSGHWNDVSCTSEKNLVVCQSVLQDQFNYK